MGGGVMVGTGEAVGEDVGKLATVGVASGESAVGVASGESVVGVARGESAVGVASDVVARVAIMTVARSAAMM